MLGSGLRLQPAGAGELLGRATTGRAMDRRCAPGSNGHLEQAGVDLRGRADPDPVLPQGLRLRVQPDLGVVLPRSRRRPSGDPVRGVEHVRRMARLPGARCARRRGRPTARGASVRTSFAKELYVSPFIDMDATYDFTTREPDDRVSVVVRETAAGGRVLVATLGARRRQLTGRSLLATLLRYPFVTLKVIGGIHWEALKLWRKGAPFRRRGLPPAAPLTIVRPANRRRPRTGLSGRGRAPCAVGARYGSRMSGTFGGALERRLLSIVGNTIRVGTLSVRTPDGRVERFVGRIARTDCARRPARLAPAAAPHHDRCDRARRRLHRS